MSNGKEIGSNNIHIEVWKSLGDREIVWLTKLLNKIIGQRRCRMSGEEEL